MKLKWIIAVGFCIFFAVIMIPRFFINRDLPEEFHGVWKTTATKYENRHFLLDKNALGFGSGDGKINWYEITRVDKTIRFNKTLYTIEFQTDEGTIFKKSLYHNSEDGGKIRFENQANFSWVLANSQGRSHRRHVKK